MNMIKKIRPFRRGLPLMFISKATTFLRWLISILPLILHAFVKFFV